MIEVELCTRTMDRWYDSNGSVRDTYHCQKKGGSCWSSGRDPEDAIDGMLRTAPELFPGGRENLLVIYLGRLPR